MIRIVRETGADGFVSIRAVGHADFSTPGKDVVCAGASVLLQAWMRNLIELLGERLHVEMDKKAGRMVFIVPVGIDDGKRADVERLSRYFFPSVVTLAEQYPEHILVSEVSPAEFKVRDAAAEKQR